MTDSEMLGEIRDTVVDTAVKVGSIDERTTRHSATLRVHGQKLTQHGEALAKLSERTKTHRARLNNLDQRVARRLLYGGGGLVALATAALAAWAKLHGGEP